MAMEVIMGILDAKQQFSISNSGYEKGILK